MPEAPRITVEFFGISRERAGRADMTINAATVAEAVVEILRQIPGLSAMSTASGAISEHYRLSINGDHFVTDGRQALNPGDRLLILSADAGG